MCIESLHERVLRKILQKRQIRGETVVFQSDFMKQLKCAVNRYMSAFCAKFFKNVRFALKLSFFNLNS